MSVRRFFPLFFSVICSTCGPRTVTLDKMSSDAGRPPVITPDYTGIVLPPNIAPLNFRVREPGRNYRIQLSSPHGTPVAITSRTGSFRIPEKKWRALLGANPGGTLRITVHVLDRDNKWRRFSPIQNRIAREPIDPYLTYRSLSFLYNFSSDMHLHERQVTSFRDKQLLSSKNFYWGCVNCHLPESNNPERTVVEYRSNDFGSAAIIATDGAMQKLDARVSYPSWRPGGDIIAFSRSRVRQCFHSTGRNPIDDYDLSSEIFVYDVTKKHFLDVPALCRQRMIQSWPTWSPDGRYLYFCSGPVLWNDFNKVPPDRYDEQRCSLLRIPFNGDHGSFGSIDTVLSSQITGRSISQPRISPDGKFALCCMHEYGPYPVTQASSDLYLIELSTGVYRRLNVSSDESESWHGWSKNGRWIVFSSKRNGGILTRLYFAHVDATGRTGKPFILPQKDPSFYESDIRCFNLPELATAPVPYTERDLLRTIKSPDAVRAPLPEKPNGPAVSENPSAEWSTLK